MSFATLCNREIESACERVSHARCRLVRCLAKTQSYTSQCGDCGFAWQTVYSSCPYCPTIYCRCYRRWSTADIDVDLLQNSTFMMYFRCSRCRNSADVSVDDQSQTSTPIIYCRSWRRKTIAHDTVNDPMQILTFTIKCRCQHCISFSLIDFANSMPWWWRIYLQLLPTVHDRPHDHVIRDDAFFEGAKVLAWPRHYVITTERLLE